MPRCLIVDDNPNNRLVARFILEDLNCEVVEADSAKVAQEALLNSPFDLMLLDWMMPQMDGVAFLSDLRQQPQFGDLKIVMCTAKEGEGVQATALDAGANHCLPKPITFDDAQRMLQALGF